MNYYNDFMNTPQMFDALRASSVSTEDANLRGREYAKMFARNDEMRDMLGMSDGNLFQKTFSGYAETPLLSTQYFNASVASYVSSFAGFMSIERDFDQPNGLFYWFDVLGVTDLRTVIPNLGPDNYQDIQTMGYFEEVPENQTNPEQKLVFGRKLIPGTIRVKVETDTQKFELIDNGQGSFMAIPGVLESGKINYLAGAYEFKLTVTPTSIKVVGKEDVTGTPSCTTGADNRHANDKRFIAKMQQIALNTVPDMLVAEYNIAALGAMKKATGSDMATFLFTKLREIYTKTINYKLVKTLEDGYNGDTMNDLDLSNLATGALAGRFYDYRSRVDLFEAYLVNVESTLAQKAVKGVTTTAYIAGANASNQFQKGAVIGKWEKNTKMTYISDLLGWYNGIPVLRSTDIKEDKVLDGDNNEVQTGTFYAIHKTHDGQMAPLARGIYMPLTDTPTIGNYNNPTQMASGIYYQEGVRYMAPELVQKVTFKMGF
jgi:hypothetical protein